MREFLLAKISIHADGNIREFARQAKLTHPTILNLMEDPIQGDVKASTIKKLAELTGVDICIVSSLAMNLNVVISEDSMRLARQISSMSNEAQRLIGAMVAGEVTQRKQ